MKIAFFVLTAILAPRWALAIAPVDYYNAGTDLFNNHEYEKAILYFHAAVEERPDYWQAYQSLGSAYYQNGNITAALMAMDESLKLHPDNQKLREFMSKIRKDSPWASKGFSTGFMPLIALVLSLLSVAWMAYWTFQSKFFSNQPPNHP